MGFGRPCGFQALHKGQDSCLCSSLSSQHGTEPCCSLAHTMEELSAGRGEGADLCVLGDGAAGVAWCWHPCPQCLGTEGSDGRGRFGQERLMGKKARRALWRVENSVEIAGEVLVGDGGGREDHGGV